MSRIKLTKRVVDTALPSARRYTLFDSEVKGFGVRVYPSGKKSWIFEYRAGEGGRRVAKSRVTIGSTVDFTPDQARKQAELIRAQTKTGRDPQGERLRRRQAVTVEEVSRQFLEVYVRPKRGKRTADNYADILKRLVLPEIGKKKAQDVIRRDLSKLHLSLAQTKPQANRVLGVVGSLYSFAAKHGLVAEGLNPVKGIDRFKEEKRERYLSVSELMRLGTVVREAETDGIEWTIDPEKKTKHVPLANRRTRIGVHAAAALRLLLFTGCRLREILNLKWDNVDLERGLLFLPTSKTGKKTVILNAPALAVLKNTPRVGVFVIAGESAGSEDERPRSDLKRPWQLVARRAGLDGVRLHDLRHNFASFGAGGGLGLPVIGKLLGHSQITTTQRYAHLDADPLRAASNSIARSIAAAMGEPATTAEIISLPVKRKG